MNPALRRGIGRMEEASDRCCRPRRPGSRREEERESPPTRERAGTSGRDGPGIMRGAPSSPMQYSPHKPLVRRPRRTGGGGVWVGAPPVAAAGPSAAGGAVARPALGRWKLRHHRGPETGEVGRAGGEDRVTVE